LECGLLTGRKACVGGDKRRRSSIPDAFTMENQGKDMKFICFGFLDETKWDAMTEKERKDFIDGCFAYDDELRRGGYFLDGEALQTARNAATVRFQNGQAVVTDGPFAETKEQIGGLLFLEARDLNHAVQLISRHPGIRVGGFEIRGTDEAFKALIADRKV
jgi:hypothetical protein